MKFSPTWPQVALLAILLAAVIVSHACFPASVAAITSIVSTIVGAMFVNLHPTKEHEAPPARVLKLVPKDPTPGDDA